MAAIGVFCASSRRLERRWLELAAATGRELARRGHRLVSGGGCVGMMGAVADGARAAGGHTLGVIPQALVDLEVADRAADELVVTADMAARKTIMIEKSDAFVTLPGGLGTLDELFEVWTTATLDLHRKPLVLVDADGFYAGLLRWLAALPPAGFAWPAALELLTVVDTAPAALDAIEARLPAAGAAGSPAAAAGSGRVAAHLDRFNAAVRTGDFRPLVAGFTPDAVLRVDGAPDGPFVGRAEIGRAYADRPPTDTMRATAVESTGDVDVVRFAWRAGGTGTMTLCWRDGAVAELTVAFD